MKKRKIHLFTYPVIILFAGILLTAFAVPGDNPPKEEWDIPEKYENMENPYAGDKSLDRVGKMMYMKNCRSCHGNKGEGDGPKAAQMETEMIPFSDADFQAQSDGAIYYQSIIGRGEMPNFEKKIPDDEDRWALINYIRSFK